MQNVPKIVRERLKVATPAVNHPDADVLTAFSEQSLPDLERAIVLEHLAHCGECRDIVALALPAADSVQTVVSPAPAGWLAWPTLRWGFVAAGIIVIASVGVLQYQRRAHPSLMAYKATVPTDAGTEARNQPQPVPVPAEPAPDRDKVQTSAPAGSNNAVEESKKSARAPELSTADEAAAAPVRQPARPNSAPLARSVFPHGPKLANQWQQQNANVIQQQAPAPAPPPYAKQQASGKLTANAPIPTATETVQADGQSTQVTPQSQNRDALVLEGKAMPLEPMQGGSAEAVARAKPAGTVVVNSAKVPVGTPPLKSRGSVFGASAQASNARWTINSVGGLQRSFDQGNTWQDVNVNESPAGTTSLDLAKESPANAKDIKSALKRDAVSATFRTVAANGADVWAGGSSGILYHSTDSGNHWTRVMPSSSGATLTGDVLTLDFPDARHGMVST